MFSRLFHKRSTSVPQEKAQVDVSVLEARVVVLETEMRLIKLEWVEVYDKIVHQFDRDRKRKAKALEPPPGPEVPPTDPPVAPAFKSRDEIANFQINGEEH